MMKMIRFFYFTSFWYEPNLLAKLFHSCPSWSKTFVPLQLKKFLLKND